MDELGGKSHFIPRFYPSSFPTARISPRLTKRQGQERSALEDLDVLLDAGRTPEEERVAASRLAELKERKASMQESLEQQAKTEAFP